MQNNYPHGNYPGQPWTSDSDNYSWRESVENATTSLDPDVYSDRNSYSRYPIDPNVPIYYSAGPDPTAFQQGLQAAYATGMQPGPQLTHHATQPQYPYATPVDPYTAGVSRSASDPGAAGQGGMSPAYYPPQARPLSPVSSTQNPHGSAMRYAPFPPPPSSPMPLPRNDGTSRQLSGTHHAQPLTVDGKQRERVFIARRRRSKCDGAQPCTNCQRYREACVYDQLPVRRGPDNKPRSVRSPPGVRKARKTGFRMDDDDDYDEHEAGPSGHY
uniref:C6 zinc finger protein n=1 Tax=Ganoderma boninense TaxID=34458 RepID=A0A5K1JWL4_9APHY|nr:C6 zinc finger protein [Ganoderma boninense]